MRTQDNTIYGHTIDYYGSVNGNGTVYNTLAEFHLSINDYGCVNESNPKYLTIHTYSRDADGKLDKNIDTNNLAPGTYEFDLLEASFWGDDRDSADQYAKGNAATRWIGKMIVTITEDGNLSECEYYIDPERLAACWTDVTGETVTADDLKVVKTQWHRIGMQTIQTAGTSTGAVGAILIPIAAVGGYYLYRRKKHPAEKAA